MSNIVLTLDDLEKVFESHDSKMRAVILLCVTELLDGVLIRYAQTGKCVWYESFKEVRGCLWSEVSLGADLGKHVDASLALFYEVDADITERSANAVVASYGVAASEVARLMHCVIESESAAQDAGWVFTAMETLASIFFPNKKIWRGDDYDAFRSHHSQYILGQSLNVLIERYAPEESAILAVRRDAQAMGIAFARILPALD